MEKSPLPKNIYSILAMFGLLAICIGLDNLIHILIEFNSRYFAVTVYIILLYTFSILVLSTGGLLIFWFITYKMEKSSLTSAIFICVGIFVLLLVLPVFPPFIQEILRFLQPSSSPKSYLFFAGGVVLMIGILSLVLPHPKENR